VTKTTFLVTTTKISLIHVLSPTDQTLKHNSEDLCSLNWKLEKLLVKRESYQKINLAPLENLQWLINCLSHSTTKSVCVDLELGSETLNFWANACKKSKKPIFIRLSSNPKLPQILYPFKWILKGFIDRLTATLLIILVSPILIFLTILLFSTVHGPIFSSQWCVGQRGRLFKIIKFRTTTEENYLGSQEYLQESQNLLDNPRMARLGCWMRRYRLDLLPRLFNILQGEMSIVGPRALSLYEAKNINIKSRSCLRALPGVINSFNSAQRSNSVRLDVDSDYELNYLSNWSLLNDLRFLMKFALKVFQ
jgi:lipopolysaccharide/colanic/teichoic acid biosynthesis glycosyltransferase